VRKFKSVPRREPALAAITVPVTAGRKSSPESSFTQILETLLESGQASGRLWQALRVFAARHPVELFRRAQENGLHVLPVHYHSPVPDTRALTPLDFRERADLLAQCCCVDASVQLSVLESVAGWAAETDDVPDEAAALDTFHWNNTFFGRVDALTYYCIVRELRPRRIVEVGGGFSTLLAARAAAANGQTELVCIDPHPVRNLTSGVAGLSRVLTVPVQRLPHEFFDELGPGDILFVDSSHVSKIGSDVNFLVLEILPRLREGVVVHFHDVFLPYEYPEEWIDGLAFLNEQYLLTAFLLFNERFELMTLNHYLWQAHRAALEAAFRRTFPPEPPVPSSLWMRRRRAGVASER
jgi:predicted O-methyltransferase YrrM